MIGWNRDTSDWKSNNPALGFNASWIIGNVTQWVAQAPTLTTGIMSLEHDLYVTTSAYAVTVQNYIINSKQFTIRQIHECLGYTSLYQNSSNMEGTKLNASSLMMYSDNGVITTGASASGVNSGAIIGLTTLVFCIVMNLLFYLLG